MNVIALAVGVCVSHSLTDRLPTGMIAFAAPSYLRERMHGIDH
jgi:hypothetical protein